MQAMIWEAFGGPEALPLRYLPDPPPGPGEIRVRSGARGVQYDDALIPAGKYQFRPEPPFIPGSEAGNPKAALCDRVRDGTSIEQAGVLRDAYANAYHARLQCGRMVASVWVLVHGAAAAVS